MTNTTSSLNDGGSVGATISAPRAKRSWRPAPERRSARSATTSSSPEPTGGWRSVPRRGELRRPDRSMIHWTLAYLAGAWLVLQLMDILSDIWRLPLVTQRFVCLALGLGILPALVVAWYHGEKGSQRVCALETVLLTGILAGSGVVLWAVFG